MKINFEDIDTAYFFASSDGGYTNEAYVNIETGDTHIVSDLVEEELPTDLYESDKYIQLPNQHDLDLGSKLVFSFIKEIAPKYTDEVHTIFSYKGAYKKFRFFLEKSELLDQWYLYEKQ